MSSQVVYQTNADYYACEEVLAKNKQLIIFDKTKKGLLWFRFTGSQTIFQLTPTGKLQVKWKDLHEKRIFYKLVKNLLVATPGNRFHLRPLKQQTWIEYPVPKSFKLYWCDQSTELTVKKKIKSVPKEVIEAYTSGFYKSENYWLKKNARKDCDDLMGTCMEMNKKIEEIFEENNKILANQYTIEDILLAGLIWENATDCFSISEIEKRTEESLILAGCMLWKLKNDTRPIMYQAFKRAVESTHEQSYKLGLSIAKIYPELAAKLLPNGIDWPSETKGRWRRIFQCDPPTPPSW